MTISAADIIFVIQVSIFFMLILGLSLARGTSNKKNLIRHVCLTVFALGFQSIWVSTLWLYLSVNGFYPLYGFPILNSTVIFSQLIFGTEAIVLCFIVFGLWLYKPLGKMNSYSAKRIMLPLLIIWVLSLIMGVIAYIFHLL
jgi:hypothetical protein